MAEAVTAFASYLLFKEIIADPLGHLYRAGEYDSDGVKRAAWLRVFDRPMVPAADLISGFEHTRQIAAAVQSTNLATGAWCRAPSDCARDAPSARRRRQQQRCPGRPAHRSEGRRRPSPAARANRRRIRTLDPRHRHRDRDLNADEGHFPSDERRL